MLDKEEAIKILEILNKTDFTESIKSDSTLFNIRCVQLGILQEVTTIIAKELNVR